MARNRREKTLADYVVIAISPILIMTLVGSLAFFLLLVAYRGQYESRVQWVMFWYVMGAVLVARIAIEQEKDQASLLGWLLAGVTALFVYKMLTPDTHLIAWGLLAVIWWCSWKLTWDCTLIDDEADSSGEGLIEAAGLIREAREVDRPRGQSNASAVASVKNKTADDDEVESSPLSKILAFFGGGQRRRAHAPGLWVVYFSLGALPLYGIGQLMIPAASGERRGYGFILLAIYVASALGLLLTTSFLGLRRYLRQRKLQMPAAMTATWIIMGSLLAIGLMIVALLVPRPQGEYALNGWIDKLDSKINQASRFAMLQDGKGKGDGRPIGEADDQGKQPGNEQKADAPPRDGDKPEGGDQAEGKQERQGQQANQKGGKQQDRNDLPDEKSGDQSKKRDQKQGKSGEQDRKSSEPDNRHQSNDLKNNQQKGASEKPDRAQSNDKRNQPDRGDNPNQKQPNQKQAKDQNQHPDQPNSSEKNDQEKQDQAKKQDQPNNQPQNGRAPAAPPRSNPSALPKIAPSNWLGSLAPLVKWILYGLLAAVVLYVIWKNWAVFYEMLRNLWNELLSLFGGGRRDDKSATGEKTVAPPAPPRPFSAFNDPFLDGSARRMPRVQLVRYTFEALEAWTREQGVPRTAEQTPTEYAAQVSRRMPKVAKEVSETAQLYARVAYARAKPTEESLEILQRLWRKMNVLEPV